MIVRLKTGEMRQRVTTGLDALSQVHHPEAPPETRARNWVPRLRTAAIPALLLLAYLAQCAWFIKSQSFTFDEPVDILSGLVEWRTGQYGGGLGLNDHPPLARLLCTLPVISPQYQITDDLALPSPEALAWRTRSVNAILGAIFGCLIWFAARWLYPSSAANFVLALFCFSPSLIAHFSLAATNDGILALTFFAAVFQLCRWRHRPSWGQTAVLGLALGALLVSKASSLPFFALAIVLVLVLKPDRIAGYPGEWNWRSGLTVLFISFLILWAAYRFHVAKVTLSAGDVRMRIAVPHQADPVVHHPSRTFSISVPFPAYEFVQGIEFQLEHSREGHYAFLLGRSYGGGSKLYFPVVILLKWPTTVLLLSLAAFVFMICGRVPRPPDWWLWALFPTLYFLFAEFSKLNTGERYILPVYPFALLLCGALWHFTVRRRALLMLLLLALAVNAADVLRYAPDYLSYFNFAVRPSRSYMLLSDSNLDWGEGLIALRHYQQTHPNVPIHLAYFGSVSPTMYGIKGIPLAPNERVSGTVIVSAVHLSGQYIRDPNGYRWVLQYPTKAILNHSLYVFEVPREATQP